MKEFVLEIVKKLLVFLHLWILYCTFAASKMTEDINKTDLFNEFK